MIILPLALVLIDCIRVDSERIPASALAASVPAFAGLPANLDFGLSPIPGVRRNIRALELNAFLRRHGGEAVAINEGLCVERIAAPLHAEQFAVAMRAVLPAEREIRVEVLEFSNRAFAEGTLEFQISALATPLREDAAVVWRGSHRDLHGRRSPVWARVKLSWRTQAWFAVRDLAPGKAIESGAVERREIEEFPRIRSGAAPWEAAEGWIPRRTIRTGQRLDPVWLDPPAAVTRGEAVTVEVIQEGMRLSLTGRAAGTARVDQKVAVVMPLSKKTLQAVVKEKGHAVIEVHTPRR